MQEKISYKNENSAKDFAKISRWKFKLSRQFGLNEWFSLMISWARIILDYNIIIHTYTHAHIHDQNSFTSYNYPHAFLKKRWGYWNCSAHRPSVTLSPPKPLDEIQPNVVCELLTWIGCATAHFFWPHPLGKGQKVKYHKISLNFNYKVNFKDFLTKL